MSRRVMAAASVCGFAAALLLAAPATFAEPLAQADLQRDFVAANDRALEGDPKGAAGLYRSLLDRGVEHAELYYNLGTVLAADEREIEAIIAYERALRLDPSHADARANLRALRTKLEAGVTRAVPPEEATVALADVIGPIVAPLPAAPIAWATLLAEVLLFAAWWFARRSRGRPARRAWVTVAIVAAAATAVCGAITAGHAFVRAEPVAVAHRDLSLRDGPDARFDVRGPVAPGARLRVLDEDTTWLQVLLEDGTSGWVPAAEVTRR